MENLRVCCVCSEKKQKLISPDSTFPNINKTIRELLDDLVHPAFVSVLFLINANRITIIQVQIYSIQYSTRVKLPNHICLQCVNQLESAYILKMTFKESIFNFAEKQNSDEMAIIVIEDDIQESENEIPKFITASSASYSYGTAGNGQGGDITIDEIAGNVYEKREYQCEICHRRYHLKGEWKTHQERHATKEKQFKCRKCELMFLTKKHFASHFCQRKK